MIDETTLEVIDQLTLYKLDFSREILKDANLPYSGNRLSVKNRLIRAVEDEHLSAAILQELLNDLDLWGQQRVCWRQLTPQSLAAYQTPEIVAARARGAGLESLLEGEVALVPPEYFTPMVIAYEQRPSGRFLRLIAAKTQIVREEQKQLEPLRDVDHPDVVYYPFLEKTQKVTAFAEINLDTGLAMISATLVRQGIKFEADFSGLYRSFEVFFTFGDADIVDLFSANKAIHGLSTGEVQLAEGRRRTSYGGVVSCKAHNPRADIRADTELSLTHQALPEAPGVYSDCHWNTCPGLKERVHTHIYGPNGEISVLGKMKEENVRYVLRRVYELNFL